VTGVRKRSGRRPVNLRSSVVGSPIGSASDIWRHLPEVCIDRASSGILLYRAFFFAASCATVSAINLSRRKTSSLY